MPLNEEDEVNAVIAEVLAGDRERFRPLVDRYYPTILSMVTRQLGDREAARDVAQESFIRAFRYLHTFSGKSSFFTWLVTIASNRVRSYVSSPAYREKRQSVDVSALDTNPAGSSADGKEKTIAMRQALQKLKPQLLEVVTLCSFEGRSYEEAATLLGIPVGTVCSRMNTALNRLRQMLTEERP